MRKKEVILQAAEQPGIRKIQNTGCGEDEN
jgi:hypothetical protein